MRRSVVMTSLFGTWLVSAAAQAAPAVTVSGSATHPQGVIAVAGTGFAASEAIDVYFDTGDTLLLVSSSTGTFSSSLTIPAAAQPGVHYVTGIGRASGDAAQKAFSVTTPWTQYGYGAAHLGWNPYENTLNSNNATTLDTLWSVQTNGYGATPAVAGGRVFVSTIAGVTALSSSTGAVLWTAATSDSFAASPTVVGNVVYVGSGNGTLYAFNATTGAVVWSKSLGATSYSSPVVVGGVVYTAAYGNDTVFALNASSGAVQWSVVLGGNIDASPTLSNGLVVIGAQDDYIYALNKTTGTVVWKYLTGGPVEGTAAISGGVVFVGSGDDKVYALKVTSGALLWSTTTGSSVYSSPIVAYGQVFVGSSDDKFYALNKHSGAINWSYTTGAAVRDAAVANNMLYVTSLDDTLYMLTTNGGLVATAVTGSQYFGSPAVSDGILYVNAENGYVTALGLLANTNAIPAQRHAPAISTLRPDMSLHVTETP